MKIKKTFQGELPENRVVNAKSNSATDAYSANYLNDKLNKVVVSPTEPTTGEDVWIKRSSNILKFDDFETSINGITFTMKDQVLHVEGTATAYTQACYMPVRLTLEEAMTLTVDWDDANLVPKAAYTYNGTSYYPNLYSQELEPGTYLNQLYFIIASGATVNTDVRFQLEKGRGFSGWQPVMEKAILVKNDNDVYEEFYDEENLEVYSTSEQRIGTWIDGKPLYRKVLVYTGEILNNHVEHGITNMAEVVKIQGTIDNGGDYKPLTTLYVDSNDTLHGNYACALYGFNSNTLVVVSGNYLKTNADKVKIRIIVEYTKTTD